MPSPHRQAASWGRVILCRWRRFQTVAGQEPGCFILQDVADYPLAGLQFGKPLQKILKGREGAGDNGTPIHSGAPGPGYDDGLDTAFLFQTEKIGAHGEVFQKGSSVDACFLAIEPGNAGMEGSALNALAAGL